MSDPERPSEPTQSASQEDVTRLANGLRGIASEWAKGGVDTAGLLGIADWIQATASGGVGSPLDATPSSPGASARLPGVPEPPRRIGRYEVLGELGHGGMGVVYRARDPQLGREVALKLLLRAERADGELVERFYREARAAASLEHPGIVQIHDVGEADGKPYYAMQLLAGRGLDEELSSHALPLRDVVDLVRQVAEAVSYAHGKGILHRDLKPRNVVVVREEGRPRAKLVDFGLARFLERDLQTESPATLTRSGQILGTPAYMSPEQVVGAHEVDARSDVYSLGATLYEALTGTPPFNRGSLQQLLEAICAEDPVPPRRLNREVDRDLETICLRCLQKVPGHRYATAAELAEDCRRWLAGEPIRAGRIGTLARLWRRAGRNKPVSAAFGVAAAVVLGVAGWLFGAEVSRRVDLARLTREAEAHLAAHRLVEAVEAARQAAALAPGEERYAGLLARALAEGEAEAGARVHGEYRARCADVTSLAACLAAAKGAERTAGPGEAESKRAARWAIERSLKDATAAKEAAWSASVLAYTRALTHWRDHAAARGGLAELYWDRYEQAERDRDRTTMRAYEPLVAEFGGDAYRERLLGAKEIGVSFAVPSGVRSLEAYLFKYEEKASPPVLVPVPYDPAARQAFGAEALLAADPSFGRSVSASRRSVTGQALPADEETALEKRASELLAKKHLAAALPVVDLLARGVPDSATYAYKLACCLAVGAGQRDPYAWLVASAGESGAEQLRARDPEPRWSGAFRAGASQQTWMLAAFTALQEALRRGFRDGALMDKDPDLAALRITEDFHWFVGVAKGGIGTRYIIVRGVIEGSEAQRIGLAAGDRVVTVAGKRVGTLEEMTAAIRLVPEGGTCEIVVERQRREVRLKAGREERLGAQYGLVDVSPASPPLLTWAGPTEGDPVARAREGQLHRLLLDEPNRVRLLQAKGDGYVEYRGRLPRGSYLLYVPAGQGVYETRYPFEVARDVEWEEECDLPAEEAPPPPPGLETALAPGYWAHLPAGPYRASNDEMALSTPPREPAIVRTAGVFLARFEVTSRMYAEYLEDPSWHATAPAVARSPRHPQGSGNALFFWPPDGQGRFQMQARVPIWRDDWPVLGVSQSDAEDYCRWLTKRVGGAWEFALPTEDEWEKGERGVDGRAYAWGDAWDPSFCKMVESRLGEQKDAPPEPEPFGLFPMDEGPFGLRDQAGGGFEWTRTSAMEEGTHRILKGGGWTASSSSCCAAYRTPAYGDTVSQAYGFRLSARRRP